VHVAVAVLVRVGAQVTVDPPAGHEPGRAGLVVALELDGRQFLLGEVVRGLVGGCGSG
jgi:hypothetical protein